MKNPKHSHLKVDLICGIVSRKKWPFEHTNTVGVSIIYVNRAYIHTQQHTKSGLVNQWHEHFFFFVSLIPFLPWKYVEIHKNIHIKQLLGIIWLQLTSKNTLKDSHVGRWRKIFALNYTKNTLRLYSEIRSGRTFWTKWTSRCFYMSSQWHFSRGKTIRVHTTVLIVMRPKMFEVRITTLGVLRWIHTFNSVEHESEITFITHKSEKCTKKHDSVWVFFDLVYWTLILNMNLMYSINEIYIAFTKNGMQVPSILRSHFPTGDLGAKNNCFIAFNYGFQKISFEIQWFMLLGAAKSMVKLFFLQSDDWALSNEFVYASENYGSTFYSHIWMKRCAICCLV